MQTHFDVRHPEHLPNKSLLRERGGAQVGDACAVSAAWRRPRWQCWREWGGKRGREEFIVLFLLLFNHKLWVMSGTFPLKAGDCNVFYLKTSKRLRTCFRWDAAEGILTR